MQIHLPLTHLLPLHHPPSPSLLHLNPIHHHPFITWLANFKLLLFCFNQGQLSRAPPNSLLLFITLAALPSKLKQNRYPKPTKKTPLNLATEPIILVLIVAILHSGREELDQPSDESYLSTLLQDFWRKRWNLMITNILRETVYTPFRSGTAYVLGEDTAVLVAVLTYFFVSGLMHEVILYHLTRAKPSWELGSFFWLHGVCVVAEVVVKRAVGGRWSLPVYVLRPLAIGLVMMTASRLYCRGKIQ